MNLAGTQPSLKSGSVKGDALVIPVVGIIQFVLQGWDEYFFRAINTTRVCSQDFFYKGTGCLRVLRDDLDIAIA